MRNLRVDPNVTVPDLPGYSDRLFENERELCPGYIFLKLVKTGKH